MTSITWSNDVDPIKTTIFGFSKSMVITAVAFFINSSGGLRDFEFVHGVEKSRARAREARKMHWRVFAHAHYKLEIDDAERRRVVQMIIAHKSFPVMYIFKR